MKSNNMKNTLLEALKQAASIQISCFGKPQNEKAKESISSVVTEVDLKSENKIIEIIRSDYPMHNILSEECGFIDNKSEYTWIIDPIDGTSNYAAGIPWFGILIAILHNGNPIIAGACLPFYNQYYFAEKGKGAFLNNEPFKIIDKKLSESLFAFSTDYSDEPGKVEKASEIFSFLIQHSRNIRCTNSLVDFLYVAEGKYGGCINMFTKIWDIAAPWLIVTEAGGNFKNIDLSNIIFELRPEGLFKNYPVISANNLVMDEINNYPEMMANL
ncbi:MAG: inositol monophosphatase [Bacteroidales bacterium]